MRFSLLSLLLGLFAASLAWTQQAPFATDANTLLLYHCDEGQGGLLRDASGHGQDAQLQGAEWDRGRYDGGLRFSGEGASVFLARPDAIRGVRQITVECWFNPEQQSGRRFLVGHDVSFHFEVDDAIAQSLSLYNQGGAVPNADGRPHQQVSSGGTSVRSGRWHHLAITYNGQSVSYFFDGVLTDRKAGPRDFSLGAPSRGLWLGCYVGMDYWYSGLMDEVRVSDCVRYDPEGRLKTGDRLFELPTTGRKLATAPAVRPPQKTGLATLKLTLRKLHGGEAKGWVYCRAPGKPAAIVGEYTVGGDEGQTTTVTSDVSDEYSGNGTYLAGLVPGNAGYHALVGAELNVAGKQMAAWSGEQRSRWTFRPPVLVALRAGGQVSASGGSRLLLPADADRLSGHLELDSGEEGQPPLLIGDGALEWWLEVPETTVYRVHMRYAAGAPRPCDLVVDGVDLNDYNMCARNVTGQSTARDAFWEQQGTVRLTAGLHWLRLQDALPDTVALWLEALPKGTTMPSRRVTFERFPVPPPDGHTEGTWKSECVCGRAEGKVESTPRPAGTRFAASFDNTDPEHLFGADRVRFRLPVKWDLEPYGRLSFTFLGTGSQHVASLHLVDAKGDEKLLWRSRDSSEQRREITVPLSFEGNDVFDPGRVVAVCLDLDEGNVTPTVAGKMAVTLGPATLQRRDTLAAPEGLTESAVEAALKSLSAVLSKLGGKTLTLRSPGFRPWPKPVTPEQHPLYATTEPKPVTRQTLGYGLHFTGTRGISADGLKQFHEDYDFGDVCWPHVGIFPQRSQCKSDEEYQQAMRDFEDRLEDVKRHKLILWDIWGYVPHGEAGSMPTVTPEHHAALLRILGDRFLGYDNGEQDGRYIGAYAERGPARTRREGWDDFVAWDKGICDPFFGYMNATGSLNFSHYYAERAHRTLGLETAQGLPSDTLMFAFLRGAGKQYGRLLTQATSIWNRYGYNMYNDRKTDGANGYGLGPAKGCSLSLHKRLFFQSYTGGDSICGSETSQFTADTLPSGKRELSPLGKQHLSIARFTEKHPDRGVMYTPVAFMLDFHNGWNMPRHLYRGDKYKIWGKFPYEKGDYAIDGVFRMVWPGYQDCSYLRNERGFITPTPYGDLFDVITNRCHPEILKQYTTLMLLGEVEITPEVAVSLQGFVEQGGDVVVAAGNAKQLPAALTGLALGEQKQALFTARPGTKQAFSEGPYTYTVVELHSAQPVLINESGDAVAVVNKVGKGRVIVCLADQFMTDQLTYADPKLVNMEPPYRLLNGLRAVLDEYFVSFSPVTTAKLTTTGTPVPTRCELNLRVNCYEKDPKRLLVTLTNNELFADWQGRLMLRQGEVKSVRDLRADKASAGLDVKVPAGDVVILDVRLK